MSKRPSSISCLPCSRIQLRLPFASLHGSSTWGSQSRRRGLAVQSLPLWDAKPVLPLGEARAMALSSISENLEWRPAVKCIAWSHREVSLKGRKQSHLGDQRLRRLAVKYAPSIGEPATTKSFALQIISHSLFTVSVTCHQSGNIYFATYFS